MKSKKQYFVIFVILIIVLSEINCINYSYAAKLNVAKNEKVIYLTFDDGPSPITNKILDILKEKDVKATFFLMGNQIKENEPTAKRIYNEGHSIGPHTYTHKRREENIF